MPRAFLGEQPVSSGCLVRRGMETDPITSWGSESQLHYGFRYNPTHKKRVHWGWPQVSAAEKDETS